MSTQSDIQLSLEQHDEYQRAKQEFIDKAFVGDRETQIEKDLKMKFEEVDMPVRFFAMHMLEATESLVST